MSWYPEGSVQDGDTIWIIEEDDTWTRGVMVERACAASMFGQARVRRDQDIDPIIWSKRNIIDHRTGERMR